MMSASELHDFADWVIELTESREDAAAELAALAGVKGTDAAAGAAAGPAAATDDQDQDEWRLEAS